MSSEQLPARVQSSLPAAPRVGRLDGERLAELRRREALGEDRLRAWASICCDAEIGLQRFRGASAIPTRDARMSLAKFVQRVLPGEVAEARAAVGVKLAEAAPRAAATAADISDGKFADADRARTQLAGAKLVLECSGLGKGAAPTVIVSEPTFSDGRGGCISVRALGERMKQRANSYSADAPIQVQAEVRSVPDGTHNPRG